MRLPANMLPYRLLRALTPGCFTRSRRRIVSLAGVAIRRPLNKTAIVGCANLPERLRLCTSAVSCRGRRATKARSAAERVAIPQHQSLPLKSGCSFGSRETAKLSRSHGSA